MINKSKKHTLNRFYNLKLIYSKNLYTGIADWELLYRHCMEVGKKVNVIAISTVLIAHHHPASWKIENSQHIQKKLPHKTPPVHSSTY